MDICHFSGLSTAVQPGQPPGIALIGAILDEMACPELFEQLRERRQNCRPGYDPEVMWRATLLRYLLGLPYVKDLLAILATSPELRTLCGFDGRLPSESTFSRFTSRLLEYDDLVDQLFQQVVARAGEVIDGAVEGSANKKLPRFGQDVAIDSTDVEAYARARKENPVDPDATWGTRTSKDPQVRREKFYGYKLHAVCDANYGIPLAYRVLPANRHDQTAFRPLIDELSGLRSVIADPGYDATTNFVYLDQRKVLAVIHTRDMQKGRGLYSVDGRPRCEGGLEMDYMGTERGRGHLFRCPEGGCHLKNVIQFSRHCDLEIYDRADTPEKLRSLGKLPRASRRWRRLYRKRGIIERMFGSMKQSRLLDQHCKIGMARVTQHILFSLLTYAGTMLAKLRARDWKGFRQMDVRSGLRNTR